MREQAQHTPGPCTADSQPLLCVLVDTEEAMRNESVITISKSFSWRSGRQGMPPPQAVIALMLIIIGGTCIYSSSSQQYLPSLQHACMVAGAPAATLCEIGWVIKVHGVPNLPS